MRTRPLGTDFTHDELTRLAEFEAREDAEESLRERVAVALCGAAYHLEDASVWGRMGDVLRSDYRRLADAAIAAITTPVRGDDV